jgi:hypothetical protein
MKLLRFLVVTSVLNIAGTITVVPILSEQADALDQVEFEISRKAPVIITGDRIYVAWWTNMTGNYEVMFRASTDAGKTFGDKINLSNTTNADSTRAEIAAEGSQVVVTWWETNQTDDVPVAKVSDDNGKTFGPLIKLGTNGTISTGEVKPLI